MNRQINQSELLQNFDKDKNVLLKKAQEQIFNLLTRRLVEVTIDKYSIYFNPLMLVDSTFQKILDYSFDNTEALEGVYENLCVAYRYKYGDNQLEIIWDGKSHEEKYKEEWRDTFERWVHDLTEHPSFIKGILQLTVFNEGEKNLTFVRNAVKAMINDYFEIKILKRNGIKRVVLKEIPIKKVS